jgi:hypothetical protein
MSQATSSFSAMCYANFQALMRQLSRNITSGSVRGRAPVSLPSRTLLEAPTVSLSIHGERSSASHMHTDCYPSGQASTQTVMPHTTPQPAVAGIDCPGAVRGVVLLDLAADHGRSDWPSVALP